MNYTITTERLGLRNWIDSDLQLLNLMNSDPRVMQYFPSTFNEDENRAFIKRMQKHFTEHNYCYFVLDLLSTSQPIGFTGLMHQNFDADFMPCIDIGWRISASEWNKGYATEAAKASLNYGFKNQGIKEILSMAPSVNRPSITVMQKIGMKRVKTFYHPKLQYHPDLQECCLYSITSNQIKSNNEI